MVWTLWPTGTLVVALAVVVAAVGTVHVLTHKKHARSAMGWIGLLWLSPFLGAALYAVLGVNRVQRRALKLMGPSADPGEVDPGALWLPQLGDLAHLVGRVTPAVLRAGNAATLLRDGDEAYPAMLEAIDGAEHTVGFVTYILDVDRWGERFVEAFARARERGVDVRVLVDGVGVRYGFPRNAVHRLRQRGVRATTFNWSFLPWNLPTLNLRNHRKILVVDGKIGVTGGMNVRGMHVLAEASKMPTRDLMVRLEGPVVGDLGRVFAADWERVTGEVLEGPEWFPEPEPAGPVAARAVPDGPDETLDAALWLRAGALSCARQSVRIATPYFLPEEDLELALKSAALRGVQVDLLIPEANNLPYMVWAAMAELGELVEHDVRVWLAPEPFDHSKMMVVDDAWALVGSANWDARSLRLNFELELECYDPGFAAEVAAEFDARRARARLLTAEELAQRSALARIRDRAFWLMKPYL